MAQMIKIDDIEYDAEKFSDTTKNQIMHIKMIDEELARLHAQIAIYQTARMAYANALKADLAKAVEKPSPAAKTKKTR
jgi:hypothetical protein